MIKKYGKNNTISIFDFILKNKKKELEIIVDKLNTIGKHVSNNPHSLVKTSIDECKELINHKHIILKSHYNFFSLSDKKRGKSF